MSQFTLESWEISPDVKAGRTYPIVESAPVIWNEQETLLSAFGVKLRSGRKIAFFHPHSVEANFIVTGNSEIYAFPGQVDGEKLERIVRKAIKKDQFSFERLFYLEGQLCLFSQERAVWGTPGKWADALFDLPFEALTAPSRQVFDWLCQQWNDLDSEVRFAWEWSRKDAQGRHEFLEARVPRWGELFVLMRDVAKVVELPENAMWILDHIDTYNHSPQLLARLEPWRKLLRAQFLPFEPFPDSAPQCLREYFAFISNHVNVRGENVSQHERLEAGLHLSEWLKQNAPERMDLLKT